MRSLVFLTMQVLHLVVLYLGHVPASLNILKIMMCYKLQDFKHHSGVRSGKGGHQTCGGKRHKNCASTIHQSWLLQCSGKHWRFHDHTCDRAHISHMVVNKSMGWVETMPHGIELRIVTIHYENPQSWIAVIWGVFPSTAILVLDVFAIAGDCVVIDSDQLYMEKALHPFNPLLHSLIMKYLPNQLPKIHIGPNLMHLYLWWGKTDNCSQWLQL